MGTMNISLPDDMKQFVDRQVSERGYGTSSEYFRDLIRREKERMEVRDLIMEGIASPKVAEATPAYFQKYRDKIAAASKPTGKTQRKRK
jgi:antitoxin ParD1/3/4